MIDVMEWLSADRFSVLNLLAMLGGVATARAWSAHRRRQEGWYRYTVDVRVEQVDQ